MEKKIDRKGPCQNLKALEGERLSEAIHCESRMPVNLSHHSIATLLILFHCSS